MDEDEMNEIWVVDDQSATVHAVIHAAPGVDVKHAGSVEALHAKYVDAGSMRPALVLVDLDMGIEQSGSRDRQKSGLATLAKVSEFGGRAALYTSINDDGGARPLMALASFRFYPKLGGIISKDVSDDDLATSISTLLAGGDLDDPLTREYRRPDPVGTSPIDLLFKHANHLRWWRLVLSMGDATDEAMAAASLTGKSSIRQWRAETVRQLTDPYPSPQMLMLRERAGLTTTSLASARKKLRETLARFAETHRATITDDAFAAALSEAFWKGETLERKTPGA
jgi:hypothetical protein